MTVQRSVIPARITFLYTNIGRGHPFYLDGIMEALIRSQAVSLVRRELAVFDLSHGLSRVGLPTARWLYRRGSSGGVAGFVYRQLRSHTDYNRDSLSLRLMGRDVREAFVGDSDPLIVAHPTMVGILRGKPELIYQHGELVTPDEAVVRGASTVLVPTPEAAEPFRTHGGYRPEQVVVTGLCIEPSLIRQAADAHAARLARYRSTGEPMIGAFFSSGAEPAAHVTRLIAAAHSVVLAGGRVILFAQNHRDLARRAARALAERSISFGSIDSSDVIPSDLPAVLIVRHNSRREENLLTSRLFSLFDFFVAPPHERSNWALGLGLPMFLIGPDIGPFAPLNRRVLLNSGAAQAIEAPMDAHPLGARIARLRANGSLTSMAQAGWGHREINGFARIAAFLVSKYGTI